jgi:hypothetical protein
MPSSEVVRLLGVPKIERIVSVKELGDLHLSNNERKAQLEAEYKMLLLYQYSYGTRLWPLFSRGSSGTAIDIFFDAHTNKVVYFQLAFSTIFN